MVLINDGASIVTEEDRISNLPDDITYHILSFMDMKYAVQTSILSRKWKHIWTLMPRFNLNSDKFCSLRRFGNFVAHTLSHRNNHAEVSSVHLNIRGSTSQFLVKHIVNYAYLHNLRQLTICGNQKELPQCLFSSHTLKHLTLFNHAFCSSNCFTPNSSWDFPALETLILVCMRLGDGSEKNLNLFSKCVNLKDISLYNCCMKGVEVFNVCVPQLSSFTVTESTVLPKVFYLVAPQLETLTASASVSTCSEGLAACSNFLHLSTPGFTALEKVSISLSNSRLKKERHVPSLLELFRILHSVKFLVIDVDVIKSLSTCLDRLSREPCPFDNLKCLKIYTAQLHQTDCIPTIPTQVRNYLLENSPNATFIMDLPQVPQKRSLQQEESDTVAKKVARLEAEEKLPGTMTEEKRILEAKVHTQDQVIAQEKAKIQAQSQDNEHQMANLHMQDQVSAQPKAKSQAQFQVNEHQMANVHMQDQVISQQKEKIPGQSQVSERKMAKIRMQRQVIEQQKAKIQAQFQVNEDQMAKIQLQDHIIAQQKEKIQMHDQIIAKYKKMFREKIQKHDQLVVKERATFEAKMQMQDKVIAKMKDMLAAQNLQREKLISQIIKCKMTEMKVQVQSGNPDYEVICSVGRDIKSAMDMIPRSLRVNVEAEFSSQYEVLKCLLLTCIDASQWARIETELKNLRLFEKFHSDHSQWHVLDVERPAALIPSQANMTAFSRVVLAGSNKMVQPSQSSRM